MALRGVLAVTLGGLLAVPPGAPAAQLAMLRGTVTTLAGARVSGVDLELVSLDTGRLTQVRTDGAGGFEARLDPASYKIELQGGYTIVRGPRTVSIAAGDTLPAEIVVADAQGAPADGSDPGPAAAKPSRRGDALAVALFSSALAGVVIRAATVKDRDRKPPTTSRSR